MTERPTATEEAELTHRAPLPGMTAVLDRNIRRMRDRAAAKQRESGFAARLSDRITRFAGSMGFVVVHAVVYGLWIAVNLRAIPAVRPFDPSFVVLAMEASVEAIFLSTFVLISQNRMMGQAAERSDLDLQINLLTEHELTRLVKMVDAMAQKMGVATDDRADLDEVERDVSPEAVLDELARSQPR